MNVQDIHFFKPSISLTKEGGINKHLMDQRLLNKENNCFFTVAPYEHRSEKIKRTMMWLKSHKQLQ